MSGEINYSDGEIENEIFAEIRNSDDVRSSAQIALEKQTNWPFEYHLSTTRANLIKHINFSGKKVLEVGAGMGAISRYVAEECDFLQVVEGTAQRLKCLKERLRDLSNYDTFCGNFQNFESKMKFDVVLVVGVLEYAEMYYLTEPGKNPFVEFLSKVKSHLAPNGVLILAIENRLGLKYWAGASEDHTGMFFDGLLGYKHSKSVRTFSKLELTNLLNQSGFDNLDFQYPFPDYKMPKCILFGDLATRKAELFADLAGVAFARDYSRARITLFPEVVCFDSLNSTGLIQEFANSFLVVAGQRGSEVQSLFDCSTLALNYTLKRQDNILTKFSRSSLGPISVTKALQNSNAENRDYGVVSWVKPVDTTYLDGQLLINYFRRAIAFQDWETFDAKWAAYLIWLIKNNEADRENLQPRAWDLIPQNVVISGDNFLPIDQEWVYHKPFKKSWMVLRFILSLGPSLHYNICKKYGTLSAFYESGIGQLGVTADLTGDIELEIGAQVAITGRQEAGEGRHIEELLQRRICDDTAGIFDYRWHLGDQSLLVLQREVLELKREKINLDRAYDNLRAENAQIQAAYLRITNHWAYKIAKRILRLSSFLKN